ERRQHRSGFPARSAGGSRMRGRGLDGIRGSSPASDTFGSAHPFPEKPPLAELQPRFRVSCCLQFQSGSKFTFLRTPCLARHESCAKTSVACWSFAKAVYNPVLLCDLASISAISAVRSCFIHDSQRSTRSLTPPERSIRDGCAPSALYGQRKSRLCGSGRRDENPPGDMRAHTDCASQPVFARRHWLRP